MYLEDGHQCFLTMTPANFKSSDQNTFPKEKQTHHTSIHRMKKQWSKRYFPPSLPKLHTLKNQLPYALKFGHNICALVFYFQCINMILENMSECHIQRPSKFMSNFPRDMIKNLNMKKVLPFYSQSFFYLLG